jgi:hypothetical protein
MDRGAGRQKVAGRLISPSPLFLNIGLLKCLSSSLFSNHMDVPYSLASYFSDHLANLQVAA